MTGRWIKAGRGVLLALLLGVFCMAAGLAQKRPTATPPPPPAAAYGPWRSSKIGGGGYIQNVVLCPSDPRRVYAYVDVGGVYRSDDGGRRWRMMNRTLRIHSVRSLLVDPRNADRVLIAVGHQWDEGTEGVLESVDGGETWRKVLAAQFYGNEDYRAAGVVLARDPANPDVVLAASGGTGLFRSADNGRTWKKQGLLEGIYPTDVKFDRRGNRRVWLCASPVTTWGERKMAGGFFRSEDGGLTWSKIADKAAPTEIVQDPVDSARLYGIFGARRIDISRDGGQTWQPFSEGLPLKEEGSGNVSEHRFDALAAGPGFVVTASTRGTFYRRGLNDPQWQKIERQGVTEIYEGEPWHAAIRPGAWQHFGAALGSIIIDPKNPRHWFFTDWYAVYQTFDAGRNWTLTMDGIEVTVLHALTQDPSDPGVVHLGMADNGYLRSEDGGARFHSPHVNSNMKSIALCANQAFHRVYGVGDAANGRWESNTVYISDDRGRTWTRSPMTGLPPDRAAYHSNSIAVHYKNPNIVYLSMSKEVAAGKGGVYQSRDGGKYWAWMGEGLPVGESFFTHDIWSIGREIAAGAGGALVAISRDRKAVYYFGPVKEGPGQSAQPEWKWQPAKVNLVGKPYSVVGDRNTDGAFYLGVENDGVYRSRDGGRSFQRVYQGDVHHVTIDEGLRPWKGRLGQRVAAGTKDGILLSTDSGDTWKMLDKRLPHRVYNLVAFTGDRLITGSSGSGAFWIPLTPQAARPIAARPIAARPIAARPQKEIAPAARNISGDTKRRQESSMPDSSSSLSAPQGAVTLFDGSNLDEWTKRGGNEKAAWPIENGSVVTRGGDIVTRQKFEDFHLHVEFLCPDSPPEVTGQGRSNSGVFLQGRYEIQVLDSWGRNPPGRGDCGALYNRAAPLVNASKRPDEWQSYDIFFRAPRFDGNGRKTENARVSVLHNGILIHNNVEAPTQTGGALNEDYADPGPIMLQDHGNSVRYRNIWIAPLPKEGSEKY